VKTDLGGLRPFYPRSLAHWQLIHKILFVNLYIDAASLGCRKENSSYSCSNGDMTPKKKTIIVDPVRQNKSVDSGSSS
jgi:hypothetical protein